MNYEIFDEAYYLAKYPWVLPGITQGAVKSGLDHFQRFGRAAGLTNVSRYFDEETYQSLNPDLVPLIRSASNPNAPFASGLDHFIQFGYAEGRTRVSPEYDEGFYLRNNAELQPFIQNGSFKNGYHHFIKFGSKEGRFGTSFFEPEYLDNNPDITPFVNRGVLDTGREHYEDFGRFESNRSGTFVGSRFNDNVTAIGVGGDELIGVEVGIDANRRRQYESLGVNEFDILTGGPGGDLFVLGVPASSRNLSPTPLYLGNGQATIRNFDINDDFIQLQGSSLDNYRLIPVGANLSIQTRFGDVVGVIEGGANLNLTVQGTLSNSTFLIG